MPVSPVDLLQTATALARTFEPGTSDDIELKETILRRSISLSYYACYHRALQLASRIGYKYSKEQGGMHEALWNWYADHLGESDIYSDAAALKARRVDADYKLSKQMPSAIDIAEKAFELMGMIEAVEVRELAQHR